MNITIIGTGYVGLVTGACFAEVGNNVCCVDIDEKRINMLNHGEIPIYEPGLKEIVERNVSEKRLSFTTNTKKGIYSGEIIFIAVGTPSNGDGSAYLEYIYDVANNIGIHINEYKIIIVKSTVPVGTTIKIKNIIKKQILERQANVPFDIAFCPEFLKEGSAVNDFMKPDRVIVGLEQNGHLIKYERIKELFAPFVQREDRFLIMNVSSAELTKYASNAMLATRISLMNEIATFCEQIGADINDVRKGMGADSRIGSAFLYAGIGYGGSCFPKDVKALIHTASQHNIDLKILGSVEKVNNRQKIRIVDFLTSHFRNNLTNKTFTLWGLSFKPHTDDIREAPSLAIIQELVKKGAKINAYDPIAIKNTQNYFKNTQIQDSVTYFSNNYDALENSEALIIATEWPLFRKPDFEEVRKRLKSPLVFDGRNIYSPSKMKDLGFIYYSIGREAIK